MADIGIGIVRGPELHHKNGVEGIGHFCVPLAHASRDWISLTPQTGPYGRNVVALDNDRGGVLESVFV